MKMKSVMFLAVALGCGLVAMAGVHQQMSGKADDGMEYVKVLVATGEIPPGTKLDETNVVLKKWPKDNVPEGAVTAQEEFEDRALITRAYPGEVVLLAKLGDKGVFGAASAIPDGMRVVSIPVDMTMTHSGLLQPHDRVDVMVTFKVRGDRGGYHYRTRTVLQFVEVFATDSKRDSATSDGEETKAKNISLLVDPQQGALLKLAESKGTLHLALRSKTDNHAADEAIDVSDADFEQWIANGVQPTDLKNDEGGDEESGDIVGFLDEQAAVPVPSINLETMNTQPTWSIEVFSGETRTTVDVIDDKPVSKWGTGFKPTAMPSETSNSAGPLAILPGGSMLEPFRQWFGGTKASAPAWDNDDLETGAGDPAPALPETDTTFVTQ